MMSPVSTSRHGRDSDAAVQFWNEWNQQYRGRDMQLPPPNLRQADTVATWMRETNRGPRDIVEVGCGTGWLCGALSEFGTVSGIDLADEAIQEARGRYPDLRFVACDFMSMTLEPASVDVVVTLEVLSHVADQRRFIARVASMLRTEGLLMLATQNRFVLQRMDGVARLGAGQIRNWVDAAQLRALLTGHFKILHMTSLYPTGSRGLLRLTNSAKLHALLGAASLRNAWNAQMERWKLGHTLIVLARKCRER